MAQFLPRPGTPAYLRAKAAWNLFSIDDPTIRSWVEDVSIGPAELQRMLLAAETDFISMFYGRELANRPYLLSTREYQPVGSVPRPRSHEQVVQRGLAARRRFSQLQQGCPICFEAYERKRIGIEPRSARDPVELQPCGHIFHKDCADDWASRSATCPTCRVYVSGRGRYYVGGSAGRTGRYISPGFTPSLTGRGRYLPYTVGPYRRIVLR